MKAIFIDASGMLQCSNLEIWNKLLTRLRSRVAIEPKQQSRLEKRD
jgi:hypothetical protein